jgi:hypothetical protein
VQPVCLFLVVMGKCSGTLGVRFVTVGGSKVRPSETTTLARTGKRSGTLGVRLGTMGGGGRVRPAETTALARTDNLGILQTMSLSEFFNSGPKTGVRNSGFKLWVSSTAVGWSTSMEGVTWPLVLQ